MSEQALPAKLSMSGIQADNPESAMESFVPYLDGDDKKTKYLSYRACGFTVKEAMKLADVRWMRAVRKWRREDPVFKYWESEGIAELQKQAGSHFVLVEFLRNFRMLLEKDYAVISKSVHNPDELTAEDKAYLARIRGLYTPQQLEAIRAAIQSKEPGANKFDFTTFVLNINSGGR